MQFYNKYNDSSLHYAVRIKDNLEIVKLLIENGANINIQNNYLTSSLHNAVFLIDNFEIVKLLIENGANINI